MKLRFPESSRSKVESMSKDVKLVAEYIPDEQFDYLTTEVYVNHNGGNRAMTNEEVEETAKHGKVSPYTKAQ